MAIKRLHGPVNCLDGPLLRGMFVGFFTTYFILHGF